MSAAQPPGPSDAAAGPVEPPSLAGRSYTLRPLVPDLYPWLYGLVTQADVNMRWRYRGALPRVEQFVETLWVDVLAQFAIADNRTGAPVGLVVVYGVDYRNRYASLGLVVTPGRQNTHVALEASALMLDHVFAAYDLRKIYLEVPEYNLLQMTGIIDKYFTVEGRRREHIYYRGRYHDEVILSISQAHFMALRHGWLAPMLRAPAPHPDAQPTDLAIP